MDRPFFHTPRLDESPKPSHERARLLPFTAKRRSTAQKRDDRSDIQNKPSQRNDNVQACNGHDKTRCVTTMLD